VCGGVVMCLGGVCSMYVFLCMVYVLIVYVVFGHIRVAIL